MGGKKRKNKQGNSKKTINGEKKAEKKEENAKGLFFKRK